MRADLWMLFIFSIHELLTLGLLFSTSLTPVGLSAIISGWQITSTDVFSEAQLPLITKSLLSFFKAAVRDERDSFVDSTEGWYLPLRFKEREQLPSSKCSNSLFVADMSV